MRFPTLRLCITLIGLQLCLMAVSGKNDTLEVKNGDLLVGEIKRIFSSSRDGWQ
ncbi:MAG: hypothetical protein IH596_05845 [Bacteroidales bacterium]|nr:hypothetical protein [Bacteroidales bacterium]